EDGIRYFHVTGVQTCALPIFSGLMLHVEHLVAALGEQGGSQRAPQLPTHDDDVVDVARGRGQDLATGGSGADHASGDTLASMDEIGRASCRERAEVSRGGGAV